MAVIAGGVRERNNLRHGIELSERRSKIRAAVQNDLTTSNMKHLSRLTKARVEHSISPTAESRCGASCSSLLVSWSQDSNNFEQYAFQGPIRDAVSRMICCGKGRAKK